MSKRNFNEWTFFTVTADIQQSLHKLTSNPGQLISSLPSLQITEKKPNLYYSVSQDLSTAQTRHHTLLTTTYGLKRGAAAELHSPQVLSVRLLFLLKQHSSGIKLQRLFTKLDKEFI